MLCIRCQHYYTWPALCLYMILWCNKLWLWLWLCILTGQRYVRFVMMTSETGSCTQSLFHTVLWWSKGAVSPICEAYIQDLFNQFTPSQVHHFLRWILGASVQSCKKVRTITFSFRKYKTCVRAFHKSYCT